MRALAFRLSDTPPEGDVHESGRTSADITGTENALRLPWRAPDVIQPLGESKAHEPTSAEKAAALTMMAALPAIEIARLKNNLRQRFEMGDNAFRLQEMLEWYSPGGNWLLDVVGYLELARANGSKHVIRLEPEHSWIFTPTDGGRAYRLPQIYFYR